MKTSFKNAMGWSVLSILIFASCSKGKGTTGETPDPNPTPTNSAVIKEFKPSSTTVSVVLTVTIESGDNERLLVADFARGRQSREKAAP